MALGDEAQNAHSLDAFKHMVWHECRQFLEIYCFDSKLIMCVMCYIMIHNSHKWSDVNKVIEEFDEQMASDVDSIMAGFVNI